jgi:hypothetical protein
MAALQAAPVIAARWRVRRRAGLGAAALLVIASVMSGRGQEAPTASTWDANLLSVQLQDVRIKTNRIVAAWLEMATKYLLRANLCIDEGSPDQGTFGMRKDIATEGDLLQAFLTAYPTYTYTKDEQTGVIWIHGRGRKYSTILAQRVLIRQGARQVQMYNDVLTPLSGFIRQEARIDTRPLLSISGTLNYPVDLPRGVYSVRDILNLCCCANPTKAFLIGPTWGAGAEVSPVDLQYDNPLAPPRAAAVRFWEQELGRLTGPAPRAQEVSMALRDASPRKRWAARCYYEATAFNYRAADLLASCDTPDELVWAALGIEAAVYRGTRGEGILPRLDAILRQELKRGPADTLAHLQDPGIALLTALELSKSNTSTASLDEAVRGHRFTSAERANVEPDLCRLGHGSRLVVDKLGRMSIDPDLAAEVLREFENTNLFTQVQTEVK